ncbi:hypothetical protein SK128_010196 [Halocaridina rubra]|uniref:NACHT domain-containing protein n=1 Tax=Halocaridina rubra TaxID=373956 RepID=A0AAN9AF34_HALRR
MDHLALPSLLNLVFLTLHCSSRGENRQNKIKFSCFRFVFIFILGGVAATVLAFVERDGVRILYNFHIVLVLLSGDLKRELSDDAMAIVSHGIPHPYVQPTLKDTRGETAVIENIEEFLNSDRYPVFLCGTPGSGKSTILQKLLYNFYHSDSHQLNYGLVIYLVSADRLTSLCDFRDAVQKKIRNSCPNAVLKHGIDAILNMIYCGINTLFLVSWNVNSVEGNVRNLFGGKWVMCTQVSDCETTPLYHAIRVMPLNDTLVKQVLSSFISDPGQYQLVLDLYDSCSYKGLIDSPDIVAIFSETRVKTPSRQLLLNYIDKKLNGLQNFSAECRALGKIAFSFMLVNKTEYPKDALCGVCDELKHALLIPHRNNTYAFKYRIIEDLLASLYVLSETESACKQWLRQVPLFKSVFRYTCAKWSESEEVLQANLRHVELYLKKYFGIAGENKASVKYDILQAAEEYSSPASFTKWQFLISLAECCDFQDDMMQLLCGLVAKKSIWTFKCKFLDGDKLSSLKRILRNIKLTEDVIIRIESGYIAKTLIEVWHMLSDLPGLSRYVSIEITIRYKKRVPLSVECGLPLLSRSIAEVQNSIYITKYAGPFMCSDTPEFLKCRCMRKLKVLDVSVYDTKSLVEVLSCEGLSNLEVIRIKVHLRKQERDPENFQKLILPRLPKSVSLNLIISYFDKLADFLNLIDNPASLHSLVIHKMRIRNNFQLNFSAFENLESLFINFHDAAASHLETEELNLTGQNGIEPLEIEMMDVEAMETEQICKGELDHKEHLPPGGQCDKTQDLPHCYWMFELSMKLHLPRSLQRLLLRNAGFCNDSNSFHLIEPWKKNNIHRLTILDSHITVKGVRKILATHVAGGDEEVETCMQMKRARMSGMSNNYILRECLAKNPRLSKEEREMRRRNKPEGKELIITSQVNLCHCCQQFPCCSQLALEKGSHDTLLDVVDLIQDAYEYNLLSLSYNSEIVTIRKNLCGDLRVHCCLMRFSDTTIRDINRSANEDLKKFFKSLVLAQYITLESTDLTVFGAEAVCREIIELKKAFSSLECLEPFSLTVRSTYHPVAEEVENSSFIYFLKHEENLAQFKFCCHCEKESHYIKKTMDSVIYFNDRLLNVE